MSNPDVTKLAELAEDVKAQRDAADRAFAQERAATEALWLEVKEAIRPALPALCPDNEKCLLLYASGSHGSLWLLVSGSLFECHPQGEATDDPDLFRRWPIHQVIARIAELLEKQKRGNLERRTREANARVLQLQTALKALRE